jgi:F-type H+-transporting ATPase subunit gamma
MATLRDIKRKIEAVKKTAQITKAMNMVAASKLRGAQQNMEKFHPYATKFREVMGRLAAGVEDTSEFDLLTPREQVQSVELVLITADRGLCGSFNNNLIVAANRFINAKEAEGIKVTLVAAGKKGRDHFKRRSVEMRKGFSGLLNKPNYAEAAGLAAEMVQGFESGTSDEVYVIYSHFLSVAKQIPTTVKLLPLVPETGEADQGPTTEYLFEPSREAMLSDLLPNFVNIQMLEFLYQTAVGEHAARMMAMENATTNAKDLVRTLTLTYNKARQAGITKELMDIVGGVEALKK